MKRVYLAGGISDTDRKRGQQIVAQKIRNMGYDIYAPSENDSINDKSNDPTPIDIYNGDIDRVMESDIFVVRISGGNEDGTLSEIGMVAGWNEMAKIHSELAGKLLNKHNILVQNYNPIKIIAYTTNERMVQPQFWNGIASGGFNHLIAGMIDKFGVFVGGEEEMLEYMEGLLK